MVQLVDPGVETAGVRRLQEAELLAIEVMAELVQQRVKKAAIGGHLPEHRRAHPDPDPVLLEVIVTEQLGMSALPDAPRPGPEDPQCRLADLVGSSEEAEDRLALRPDTPWIADGDRCLKKSGAGLQVAGLGEGHEAGERVALVEFATRLAASGRAVGRHAGEFNDRRGRRIML